MKVIAGIANIYHEVNGEHMFDYSIFVYPNSMIANAQISKQGPKERLMMVGGRSVNIRIEIPELEGPLVAYPLGWGEDF